MSGLRAMGPEPACFPTLDVQADIEPTSSGGVLQVPDNPAQVGWWTGSSPAGSAQGTTVIDGHVDSAVTGIGALFYISRLQAGDTVTLTTAAATTVTYHVYARHVYVKDQGLPPSLFTSTGPPHLLLITCGGPFDKSTRNYLDNIAVLASPT